MHYFAIVIAQNYQPSIGKALIAKNPSDAIAKALKLLSKNGIAMSNKAIVELTERYQYSSNGVTVAVGMLE